MWWPGTSPVMPTGKPHPDVERRQQQDGLDLPDIEDIIEEVVDDLGDALGGDPP